MEDIVKYNGEVKLTKDDIRTLEAVGIIPKDTPPAQVELFARVCAEKNLSPFSKQIHLIARRDSKNNTTRYTHQTAIDGFRAIADRTQKYAGNDDYLFDDNETEYQIVASGKKRPQTATATIYKIVGGVRCPFSATARWEEYYPGGTMGFMWDKMPFLMLGKCAESLALRKAFPENLGGIYTNEEMMQAEAITIDPIEPKKVKKTINQVAAEMFEPPMEIVTEKPTGKKKPLQPEPVDEIADRINKARTIEELVEIHSSLSPKVQAQYVNQLSTRKSIIKANTAA